MYYLFSPPIYEKIASFFLYLESSWNVVLDFGIKHEYSLRNGWVTHYSSNKFEIDEISFFISWNIFGNFRWRRNRRFFDEDDCDDGSRKKGPKRQKRVNQDVYIDILNDLEHAPWTW